jgi:GNAT superfamily N-acetyltransferase
MAELFDKPQIRALLEADRVWAAYALGDLAPGFFEDCRWYATDAGVAMVYSAFATPVFFYLGDPAAAAGALVEANLDEFYVQIRPEVLPAVERGHTLAGSQTLLRMVLDPARFRPETGAGTRALSPPDLPALQRLYEEEPPEFFFPSMLQQGVFRGQWEGSELIAVAGTHLVNLEERVGIVGNVYTRPDRRGRGLAGSLTSAVAADLLLLGATTIALNVREDNEAAVRVYRRLGFGVHCRFVHGVARKRR